jgi:hypothetical protein
MKKLLLPAVLAALFAGVVGAQTNPPAGQDVSLKGEVLEVLDVDSYTYLRLRTKDGETWAAVNKSPVKKGAQVTIEEPMEMSDFTSKSLNKTFPTIIFGTLGGAAVGSAMGDPNHVHGDRSAATEIGTIQVAMAQGPDARTVAEIVGKSAELKDKPVTVRGKVVKVAANILEMNWVHLRDGSGSAKDGTDDILVTTKDEPQVGDIVVAKGIVRTNVDFGAGYAYKVLVDSATLTK